MNRRLSESKGPLVFVSDLDGTLLGPDGRLSEPSAAMLNEAIGRGANISVATARTPSTLCHILSDVEFRLPLTVMTGSAVWEQSSGKYIDRITMPPSTASAVLREFRQSGIPAFIYRLTSDDILHISHIGPLSSGERDFIEERVRSPYKRFHLREDNQPDLPDPLSDVILFYAMDTAGKGEETHLAIKTQTDTNPLFYKDIYGSGNGILEVFSKQASKSRAPGWLKKHTGATKAVAFGDNINDIPMLLEADVAVAVENAVDEVKNIADIIIGPNSSDSVARFILENS